MVLDILAFVVSIIAIILSIIAIYFENKNVRININSVYFNEIFEESILRDLPLSRRMVRFDENNRLIDTDPMLEVLRKIRKDSLFFMYYRKDFYDILCKKLQEIEDYIITTEEIDFYGNDQIYVFNNIDALLREFYCIIESEYTGKTK